MSSSMQHPKHRRNASLSDKFSNFYHDMTDSEPDQRQRNARFVVSSAIGAALIAGILTNADRLQSEIGSSPQPDVGVQISKLSSTNERL